MKESCIINVHQFQIGGSFILIIGLCFYKDIIKDIAWFLLEKLFHLLTIKETHQPNFLCNFFNRKTYSDMKAILKKNKYLSIKTIKISIFFDLYYLILITFSNCLVKITDFLIPCFFKQDCKIRIFFKKHTSLCFLFASCTT